MQLAAAGKPQIVRQSHRQLPRGSSWQTEKTAAAECSHSSATHVGASHGPAQCRGNERSDMRSRVLGSGCGRSRDWGTAKPAPPPRCARARERERRSIDSTIARARAANRIRTRARAIHWRMNCMCVCIVRSIYCERQAMCVLVCSSACMRM